MLQINLCALETLVQPPGSFVKEGGAPGLGHSQNNGSPSLEAKGLLFWECLSQRVLHNIKLP